MKIAVSTVAPESGAKVEPRFGRTKLFMVFDTDNSHWSSLENSVQMNSSHGAGIQTAQMLSREGIDRVVTGHCGPNAWKVLSAAEIPVYLVASRTAEEAVKEVLDGKIQPTNQSDVEGHWQE
jgi:predicted Fe-Mo cluster-binding NifX family protein